MERSYDEIKYDLKRVQDKRMDVIYPKCLDALAVMLPHLDNLGETVLLAMEAARTFDALYGRPFEPNGNFCGANIRGRSSSDSDIGVTVSVKRRTEDDKATWSVEIDCKRPAVHWECAEGEAETMFKNALGGKKLSNHHANMLPWLVEEAVADILAAAAEGRQIIEENIQKELGEQ